MSELKMKKKSTALSTTRERDFARWYQEVVAEADLAEMAHVRGCMVIRPWGYGIWSCMRDRFDHEIQLRGHENVYFPVFIPLSYIQKEAEHVEGFAKEMAVVTHHRLERRDGKLTPTAPLEEPIVVRPTSEAIIGESMAKWIQSYRDLPLLLNQWANVVRWELRPRVFLRTTEFLWQEGHTAHAGEEEALREALDIHEMYRAVVEEWLAIPVIPGEKPPTERFPGAERSFSIEAMMQDGKAVQSGTSHYLGQNFSRAADIGFLDERGVRRLVYTTSWGVSTRLVGALIMTHGDDDGMSVPPRIAPHQVVIIPFVKGDVSVDGRTAEYANRLAMNLKQVAGPDATPIRVHVDIRPHRPVDKKWQWIKKGVPILVELGPRDVDRDVVSFRRRLFPHQVHEEPLALFIQKIGEKLNIVQKEMFEAAQKRLVKSTRRDIKNAADAMEFFGGSVTGFVLGKWCGSTECEIALNPKGVTIRCLPFGWEADGDRCLICGQLASSNAVWGLSY